MFVTFTDWSMDVPEEGVKTAEEMWPEIQAAGAISMRIVKTRYRCTQHNFMA